jgi:uncharacterized protein (DUF305 family)
MRQILIGAAFGLVIGAVGSGLAQQGNAPQQMPMQHGQHAGAAAASESEKAYRAANAKMHKAMAIKYTGDADQDFVAGMIPHHQGAIDMARAELRYGRNEQLRRLAQEIIVSQTQEIAVMRLAVAPPPDHASPTALPHSHPR